MAAELRVERRGPIWILTLDNEAKRNAVGPSILQQIPALCREAEEAEVRCLILTGQGERAFSAGYDLRALGGQRAEDPLPDELLQKALAALERCQAPVIAAVNGAAYGAGCELAVACDLRLAAENAIFSMPPARLGIVYAPEGLARFVDLVGPSRAKRLFYLGEAIDAREALEMGLVDALFPAGQALEAAVDWAERIAKNAPRAVQGMKRVFHLLRRRELPQAAVAEVESLRRLSFQSEDAKEGIAAVLERRPPKFTGR